MLLAVVLGISVGIVTAAHPGGWLDRFTLAFTYLGISFPVYWVGLILILVFAMILRWLPPSGTGGLAFLVLPAFALGTRSIAFLARMTRSAMLARHALRNALIPVVTVIGLDFGSYLTGSILTETVFSWPGLGRYVVNAIGKRDLPAIQGSILFLSVVFVVVNILADAAYATVDPRVEYS